MGTSMICLCSIKSYLPSLYPLCHSRDKVFQALCRISVLQAMESWAGLGNEASLHPHCSFWQVTCRLKMLLTVLNSGHLIKPNSTQIEGFPIPIQAGICKLRKSFVGVSTMSNVQCTMHITLSCWLLFTDRAEIWMNNLRLISRSSLLAVASLALVFQIGKDQLSECLGGTST